jgi:hypothetical protein
VGAQVQGFVRECIPQLGHGFAAALGMAASHNTRVVPGDGTRGLRGLRLCSRSPALMQLVINRCSGPLALKSTLVAFPLEYQDSRVRLVLESRDQSRESLVSWISVLLLPTVRYATYSLTSSFLP